MGHLNLGTVLIFLLISGSCANWFQSTVFSDSNCSSQPLTWTRETLSPAGCAADSSGSGFSFSMCTLSAAPAPSSITSYNCSDGGCGTCTVSNTGVFNTTCQWNGNTCGPEQDEECMAWTEDLCLGAQPVSPFGYSLDFYGPDCTGAQFMSTAESTTCQRDSSFANYSVAVVSMNTIIIKSQCIDSACTTCGSQMTIVAGGTCQNMTNSDGKMTWFKATIGTSAGSGFATGNLSSTGNTTNFTLTSTSSSTPGQTSDAWVTGPATVVILTILGYLAIV